MTEAAFDLLGIGNAIVDVLARVDDRFLDRQGLRKGSMTLIDAVTAARLYAAMPPTQETSGGSAANTCAFAAALGARVAFVGKVAEDQLGAAFHHDITAAGVSFPTPPLIGGVPTAVSLIAVTPDGQRTMSTFLGAAQALTKDDLDPAVIASAAVTYLEGYLFDPPAAQAAIRRAAQLARAASRKVALSLSDPFCVSRHRESFRALINEGIDILFANQVEICSLYACADFPAAAETARQKVPLAVLTRSELGSVIVTGEETIEIGAEPTVVVDTTGAGDAYAAGFLTGFTAGRPLAQCGRLGAIASAEVISHLGARPQRDLKRLAAALA